MPTYDLTEDQVRTVEAALPGVLGEPVCDLDERLVHTPDAARSAIDEDWVWDVPDEKIRAIIDDDAIYTAWWKLLDEVRLELGPKEEEV